MKLHTKSRDGKLYNAEAVYNSGKVTVLKGSCINRCSNSTAHVKRSTEELRLKDDLFDDGCVLNKDLNFNSLSTAATFVTGRVANGMIVWKTEDGRYVKYALSKGGE